jgi:RNA recognition motif-containing protein
VVAATDAKQALSKQKVFGCKTKVDWADPEPQVDADTMAKVRILFIKQYGGVLDERVLAKMFGRYGVVERVKNLKNYAFVHFERREDAQLAMDALDCSSGVCLDVAWAKPPVDKKTRQRMLRNRERSVRKSAVAVMSQPVRYAPRPPGRAPGAKRRVGPAPAATANTKYDHRGYDFGLRQPCNRRTCGEHSRGRGHTRRAQQRRCSPMRYQRRERGRVQSCPSRRWRLEEGLHEDQKLLNFFGRMSKKCAEND